MRRCPWTLVVSLLAAGASLVTGARAGATDELTDPLWRAAVDLAGENRGWIPGLIVVRCEQLDGSGQPKKVEEAWQRRRLGPRGEVIQEIERSTKDGRDNTARARQELATRQAKSDAKASKRSASAASEREADASASLPRCFVPNDQSQVTARRTGERRTIDGFPCVEFAFTQQRNAKDAPHGTAWLDETDGTPREVSLVPDPLPKHVKRMLLTARYERTPEGAWRVAGLTVVGSGGLLFIKRTFRYSAVASEYWRRPVATAKAPE